MRIPRIFQPVKLASGFEIILSQEATNHLLRVLRLTLGSQLIVFNGEGGEYKASIIYFDRKQCRIKVAEFYDHDVESHLNIHLAQGIARGEKMDFIIQKSVELGVNQITPLFTEYCDVHLNPERLHKRVLHWQHIAINACEQCGRNQIPQVHPPQKFTDFINYCNAELKLVLHPEVTSNFPLNEQKPQSVALLIGPEGGFSDKEIQQAAKQDYLILSIGQRVLRTETAAIASVTIMQFLCGDLKK